MHLDVHISINWPHIFNYSLSLWELWSGNNSSVLPVAITSDLLDCDKNNIHPIRFIHGLKRVNVFRFILIQVRCWIDNIILNPVIIIINGILIYICLGSKHWFMVGETLFLDLFPALNKFMDACKTLCLLGIRIPDLIRTCLTTWWLILINRWFTTLFMSSGLVWRSIEEGMNGPWLVDYALLTYTWGIWTVLEVCCNSVTALHHEKVCLFLLVVLTV